MRSLFEQVQDAVRSSELAVGWGPRPFADTGRNHNSRIVAEDSGYYKSMPRWEPAAIREARHGHD